MEKQFIVQNIKDNIGKVIIGKDHVINLLLTAVLANGHVLLEDVPGTGKTMLAKSFAKSIQGVFQRIQFTPDLLPSDLTGISYYNQKLGEFVFREGPVFGNIILADEINRATPRTQSSLLECMEERQVTVDKQTMQLKKPFLVIATQNPIETAGTFRLPEAQLDRFMMLVHMGYPTMEEENAIVDRFLVDTPFEHLEAVCTTQDLVLMQQEVRTVYIHPALRNYIVAIVHAIREQSSVLIGISPRGTLTMIHALRSYAYVNGRDYVVPEDIKKLLIPVFSHRIIMKHGAEGKDIMFKSVLAGIPVPTEEWE